MSEARKLTTIVVTNVVAFSRLTAAQEELTLARLRALRSDLIDPLIAILSRPHRQTDGRRFDR
jgi:adenylate cyclase